VCINWDDESKVKVYSWIKVDKVKAKLAFARLAEENNWTLGDSYTNWPHTHVDRFKNEFERRCFPTDAERAKGATVDNTLMALLVKYNLVEDDPTDEPEKQEPESEGANDQSEPEGEFDTTEEPELVTEES
jgi:hypothetical protein